VDDRTSLTFRYERWRAVSAGVIETAGTTFLLLIALRHFQAGPTAKALVAGGGSIGFFLAPWIVSRVELLRWPTAMAAARLFALGAMSFLTMAVLPFLPVFVAGSVLATACSSATVPLMTQIYQENYPEQERGRKFSLTFMIRIAVAAVFGELAGQFLSGHIGYFRWLLVVFAAVFAFGSYCLMRVPSRPLQASGGTHPYRALKYVFHDRTFRQTIICWMFMGFATLMMAPLRIEFLANPKYGWTLGGKPLTALTISMLTVVIPNIARLILSPIWGRLFDRMNFFVLRIVLNVGFAVGILSFFASSTMMGLIMAAIVYGVSNAGGDVAWGLWVTKFAPPDRVADYMSAHTFFTGVRGMVAPVVAFQLASAGLSLATMGWISFVMILIGTSFLFPEIKIGRSRKAAVVLVENISEKNR
jgi:MFS family permease